MTTNDSNSKITLGLGDRATSLSKVKETLEPVTPSIGEDSLLKKSVSPSGEVEEINYSVFAGLDLYSRFESAHYPTLSKVPKTLFT